MSLTLNPGAIILLLGIGYFLTLLLIIAYEYTQKGKLTNNIFFVSKFIQTAAWFCMASRMQGFDFLSISVANSLLFIAYSLETIALLKLQNTISQKKILMFYSFTIISIIGFQLILWQLNDENIRIAYYSLIVVLTYLPLLKLIFKKNVTILMRTVNSLYIIFAFLNLLRGIAALTNLNTSMSFFTTGTFQLCALLLIYLFTNLGSIGFILLLKEKVDKQLIHFATYDDLTNTLNRRSFSERVAQTLKTSTYKKRSLSYILFDIDNFKMINDTHGHQVGDQVLQNLTTQIQSLLQKDDLFGRYGGDEFGILLQNKDEHASIKTVENIHQLLNEQHQFSKLPHYTISIGIITFIPTTQTTLQMLYTQCDKVLYAAKQNGRNCILKASLKDF